MTLEQFFKDNPCAALAFSGGTDSSYLLYAGLKYGAKIKAYYVKTQFQPKFELNDALKLTKCLNADITVLEKNILDLPQIVSNPPDRCYHCKKEIFSAISEQALADGIALVIDGTNVSDDVNDRPGMRAITELFVRSPLRECGITKENVRLFSKKAGLFTWNKPSYSCLATRIPTERTITNDLLQRIENAEDALLALGFTDFRVRVFGWSAKLQFTEQQINNAVEKRTEIVKSLKQYFTDVLLDLEGR